MISDNSIINLTQEPDDMIPRPIDPGIGGEIPVDESEDVEINPTSVEGEPNDTLAQAEDTDIEPGENTEYSASAQIGNNPNIEPGLDVDLYEVELAANELLRVDLDLSDELYFNLDLFDAEGSQLSSGSSDVPFRFLASTTGTYYLGVSSTYDYDPNEEGSGEEPGATGPYEIGMTTQVIEATETEPNDILTQAEVTGIIPGEVTEFTTTAIIGNNSNLEEPGLDVDLYGVELAANELLTVDLDLVSSNFYPNLIIFDAEGNELRSRDYYGPLSFLASTAGTYYLGVSSTYDYDPNEEGSGEEPGATGLYELEMDTRVIEVTETEPNDILTQAEATEIAPGEGTEFSTAAIIGNNPNLEDSTLDVDLYAVELTATQFITININTENLDSSELDSYLRVFDAQGNELASNNDYSDPDDDFYTSGSRLTFPISEAGTYYIGVSSSDNSGYNPSEEGSGADGYSEGLYEIEVNARNQIIGTSGPDLLTGTTQIDVIRGLAGNDVIEGNQNDDILFGGDGNDVVSGGEGNDSIEGENNNDTLLGEAGWDIIFGGNGNDVISGGNDYDQLSGESGNDVISGGDSYDNISGGSGNDSLIGGNDGDSLYGGDGNDTLIGIDPNTSAEDSYNYDSFVGGDGRDTFVLGDSDRVYNIYEEEGEISDNGSSYIQDFSPIADLIQLHGSASDYRLRIRGLDTDLIYEPGNIAIATLQGAPRDLSLSGSNFVYV